MSVPCCQVKRGVPATVAGHEVGVSVYQHAHHLNTRGSCLIVHLYLLGLCILGAVAQLEYGKRLLSALIVPLITKLNRYPPPLLCIPTCVHLVNFCSVLVTSECSGSFNRKDFPSL